MASVDDLIVLAQANAAAAASADENLEVVKNLVTDLKNQLAGGTPISVEQLAAIEAALTATSASLSNIAADVASASA